MPKDLAKAAPLFEQSCELGFGGSCNRAGDQHYGGHGVPKSPERAVALYAKGCELKDADSCYGLGVLTLGGASGRPDAAAAILSESGELVGAEGLAGPDQVKLVQ